MHGEEELAWNERRRREAAQIEWNSWSWSRLLLLLLYAGSVQKIEWGRHDRMLRTPRRDIRRSEATFAEISSR